MCLRDQPGDFTVNTVTIQDVESKFAQVAKTMTVKLGPQRGPAGKLSVVRLATLCWAKAHYRVTCWKDFFENELIKEGWKKLSGWDMGSYGRFMLRIPQVLNLLEKAISFFQGAWTGLGAIDSTMVSLGAVYNAFNKKSYKKIRREGASVGHGSLGRNFGLKANILINGFGEICAMGL